MRIEFLTWIAPHTTYLQQKFTLLTQGAAETANKVLAVAVRFFLSLVTTVYSFFYPQPSDDDVPEEPPLPKPVIPDGTFPPTQQQQTEQQEHEIPPATENNIPAQLTKSPQQQRTIPDSPTPLHLVPPSSPAIPSNLSQRSGGNSAALSNAFSGLQITEKEQEVDPVVDRKIQQAPIPPSQPLSTESSVAPSNAFLDLPITEAEKKAISAFMKKSAQIPTWKALTLLPESEQIKKTYKHIHTLRSMAHFVTDPPTKIHLQAIMNNSFKRAGYMRDFEVRMNALNKTTDIDPLLPGFCKFVKADFNEIDSLLRARNYNEFIDSLLALK